MGLFLTLFGTNVLVNLRILNWIYLSFINYPLSVSFRDEFVHQHEMDPAHRDGDEPDAFAALAGDINIENDGTNDIYIAQIFSDQPIDSKHDELVDLEDSDNDLENAVPIKVGSRRTLKMVIDAEDDE